MNRFKNFTDEEVYLIKRAFAEASFEIVMTDRYTEDQVKLYNDLYNEITEEDKERLYKDDYETTPEIIITDENVIKELLGKERSFIAKGNDVKYEFSNTQSKLPKEETIENELTYEEALGILYSHSDTTDENWKCRCILEEAIEQLRKYERDYTNELVDEFMAKTVITDAESPITYPVCPHCGKSYYREDYSTSTCMYCPPIIKNGKVISEDKNISVKHCHCLNCDKDFTISH